MAYCCCLETQRLRVNKDFVVQQVENVREALHYEDLRL